MRNQIPALGASLVIVVVGGCGSGPSVPAEVGEQTIALRVEPQFVAFDALGDTTFVRAFRETSFGRLVAEGAVQWALSPDSVASIRSDGLVSSVGEGQARVTATASGQGTVASERFSASADVTVRQRATSVGVSPPSATLTVGQTRSFEVDARDANGEPISSASASWSSSNGSVVLLVDGGLVTAVSEGRDSIVATVDDVAGTGYLTVWEEGGPDNMPVGMTVALDTDFSNGLPADRANDPAFDIRYSSSAEDMTAESGVSDSEDGFVVQSNFSAGYTGNGARPGSLIPRGGVWPSATSAYYKTRLRVNPSWQNHPTNTNKLGFIDLGGNGPNFFFGFQPRTQAGTKDWELYIVVQSTTDTSGRMKATQNIGSDQFDSGEWIWVEIYTDPEDDIIKMWANGVLVLDEDGTGAGEYGYSLDNLRVVEPSIEVLWGGAGGTKTSNDWVQHDAWVLAYGDGTEF